MQEHLNDWRRITSKSNCYSKHLQYFKALIKSILMDLSIFKCYQSLYYLQRGGLKFHRRVIDFFVDKGTVLNVYFFSLISFCPNAYRLSNSRYSLL